MYVRKHALQGKPAATIMSVLTALVLIVSLSAATQSAFAGTNDYPWRGLTYPNYDTWHYYDSECTSFAAWRLHARNGFEMPWAIGNASNWYNWASSHGVTCNNTPALGAVAWFSYGHVAWVESVGNGNVTIEEYNYSVAHGYDERTIPASAVTKFIHWKDIQPTPPPAPTRQTVIIDDKNYQPMGPSQWWRIVGGLGVNNEMTYTWNERYSVCNSAIWRPNLAGGNYEVYAFIPRNYANTTCARYSINAASVCGYRTVNQNSYYDQWVSLGTYYFNPGTAGYVYLSDLTGEAENSRMVGFDAIEFVPR